MNQEKIGSFIREMRNEKKMTQQELAEKIGVTDRAISKWENGRGTPDIALLIPLSKELGITVLELLNGESIKDQNNAVIELMEKMSEDKIKILLSVAENMVDNKGDKNGRYCFSKSWQNVRRNARFCRSVLR